MCRPVHVVPGDWKKDVNSDSRQGNSLSADDDLHTRGAS
jgi:hypothetical protein